MKQFLIAVDHLAEWGELNGGYEYFLLTANSIEEAKNKVLFNFHKFKLVYLIKILAKENNSKLKTKKETWHPIINVRASGKVENIKNNVDNLCDHWEVDKNDVKYFYDIENDKK